MMGSLEGIERRGPYRGLPWSAFLIALGVSFVFILWRPLPVSPDFESYDNLAWHLVQGEGFTQGGDPRGYPELFRTPGYPWFLAPFYWTFGRSYLPVYFAQAILLGLTALLIFSLVRRSLGEGVARLSSYVVALYPLSALYVPTILAEVLSIFAVALSIWMFLWTLDKTTVWRASLTGAVMAYSALVRPSFLLLALACFLAAVLAQYPWRKLLKPFLVLHLSLVIVLGSWAVRNLRVSGEFIPLSIQAPLQLWLATFNYGPYTDQFWKNPEYFSQQFSLASHLPHVFDREDRAYPVEIRLEGAEALRPVKLHYRLDGEGPFLEVGMREAEDGRFVAEIPPQPFGTRVQYYFSLRDLFQPEARLRHPNPKARAFFFYRVLEDVLADPGPELVDIHDVIQLGSTLQAPDQHPLSLLHDIDRDGRLSEADLEKLLKRLGGNMAPAYQFHREKGGGSLQLKFEDGSQLDLPLAGGPHKVNLSRLVRSPLMGSAGRFVTVAIPRRQPAEGLVWRKPGENRLFSCSFRRGSLSPSQTGAGVSDHPFPCFWKAGVEDIPAQLMEFRAYRSLARDNFLRAPMTYFGGSLLRMPRIWVTVGTTTPGQTYLVRGAAWLFPALAVSTLGLFVLAVIGYWTVRARWRAHWYIFVPILYISLVHAPFHPEARYSLPGRAFLLVYVAVALAGIWQWWKGGQEQTTSDP